MDINRERGLTKRQSCIESLRKAAVIFNLISLSLLAIKAIMELRDRDLSDE